MSIAVRIVLLLPVVALTQCASFPDGSGNSIGDEVVTLCQRVLGACGPSNAVVAWKRPGGTLEQFEKDRAACTARADKAQLAAGFGLLERTKSGNTLFFNCMKARGYARI
jgi:hypothetical protein